MHTMIPIIKIQKEKKPQKNQTKALKKVSFWVLTRSDAPINEGTTNILVNTGEFQL